MLSGSDPALGRIYQAKGAIVVSIGLSDAGFDMSMDTHKTHSGLGGQNTKVNGVCSIHASGVTFSVVPANEVGNHATFQLFVFASRQAILLGYGPRVQQRDAQVRPKVATSARASTSINWVHPKETSRRIRQSPQGCLSGDGYSLLGRWRGHGHCR